MKQTNFLILGGNGKTGRRVAERLNGRGDSSIRIGSRRGSPAFDWENSGTWPDVIKGMDAVYISFQPDLAIPSAVDTIQHFVSMAAAAGVSKMVLLSGRGEKEAQRCEQIVQDTAASWTIVRASWFNQNFNEGIFLEPVLAGQVALPRADAPEPFVDADDIADVVVEALLDDKHDGQIYELTGPRLMTLRELVAEIGRATGREIQFHALSVEEYIEQLRAYQLSEEELWLVNYLFTEVLDGRNASVSTDIEKLLGRKAIDFVEYAERMAASGVWESK
ncbi:NAD(P)H-binding protein [Flavihumibacter sp. UBA7668]|uniref:NAD(P)H-binding protein n=1 Tax=Flavihumibacter sp. UBA7668 TaxID=1946542 RepID=UPI0025C09951|nr:NAD(P)H-binding protein [Flavihumibacter sp. UBA7668]